MNERYFNNYYLIVSVGFSLNLVIIYNKSSNTNLSLNGVFFCLHAITISKTIFFQCEISFFR